ncbi:TolC family protein [candidate division KSB1 bacterium]|nr:TolC family protein [candidate division KSB1 bacterium]
MLKRILVILVLVLASFFTTFAQESDMLSLQDCIDIALSNNYELRVAQLSLELADQDIVTSRSSWLPHVNSSFNFGKFIQGQRTERMDVQVGVDSSVIPPRVIIQERDVQIGKTERNSYSVSISLDQHIYDFGRTSNRIREAKAYKQYQEHNLFNTRNLVMANVADKYFELLKAIKLRDVYEEATKHAEENLAYNETMLDVGLKSKAEIFQARVNLGNRKTDLINQINRIELAKAALNSAMGQNPAIPIEIQEDMPKPFFSAYSFDEAVEIALENNDRLKAIENQVQASEYAIRSAKAQYAPSIGARVSYNRDNDDISRVYSTNFDEDYTATIGAGISLNIFNGLADKAEVQRQRLNNEMALEKLKEEKRILITNIREYFLMLKSFEDLIRINQENLEAYQENLRLQTEKRRVGSGTELEVMAAQVDVIQAQETLVRAEYEAKIYRAYLDAALGIIEQKVN